MAGLACLTLTACGAAVGVGSGMDYLAATHVRTTSASAVRSAVLTVFREEGFTLVSRDSESATFVKDGGRGAAIAWSTIDNSNPVLIRPTVTWRESGKGEFWVGCEVQVTQQSTVSGETVRQPLVVGKSAYHGLLQKVKRAVER